jgi:hypothetical protein
VADIAFAHGGKQLRSAAHIVAIVDRRVLIGFANVGKGCEVHHRRGPVAHNRLAQEHTIGEVSDNELAPFDRLDVAARKIVGACFLPAPVPTETGSPGRGSLGAFLYASPFQLEEPAPDLTQASPGLGRVAQITFVCYVS